MNLKSLLCPLRQDRGKGTLTFALGKLGDIVGYIDNPSGLQSLNPYIQGDCRRKCLEGA